MLQKIKLLPLASKLGLLLYSFTSMVAGTREGPDPPDQVDKSSVRAWVYTSGGASLVNGDVATPLNLTVDLTAESPNRTP